MSKQAQLDASPSPVVSSTTAGPSPATPATDLDIFDADGRVWTVYPYTSAVGYKKGDLVFVDLKNAEAMDGEGTVVSDGMVTEGQYKGRYKVVFDSNGSSAHVNPNRLSPRMPPRELVGATKCTIVFTPETVHYRELAYSSVTPSDFAIDIGSSAGACTYRLHQKTKQVIGFDISDEMLAKSRHDFPAIRFEKLNILEEVDRFVEIAKDATVAFADIGGNREFIGAMAPVVEFVLSRLPKLRLFVIKNRAMVVHAAAYLGREVSRHKGHAFIKWQGRMEVSVKKGTDEGEAADEGENAAGTKTVSLLIAQVPYWWAEGVVSHPNAWLRSWQGRGIALETAKGSANKADDSDNEDE